MQFQTVEVRKEDEELIHGCATNTEETEVRNPSALMGVMKRKKSVAKNTKKMMGKGTRIMTEEAGRGHAEGMEMEMKVTMFWVDSSFLREEMISLWFYKMVSYVGNAMLLNHRMLEKLYD
ncbi:hypothetical protein U1Q18_020225 [Sarracenia purpurea var. burkii]